MSRESPYEPTSQTAENTGSERYEEQTGTGVGEDIRAPQTAVGQEATGEGVQQTRAPTGFKQHQRRRSHQQKEKEFVQDVRPLNSGDFLRVVTGLGTGLGLGVVLEKSKVYLPYIIREQVLLHNFLLLKMFMAAVISGTLAVSLIDALSSAGERKRRTEKPTINIEVTPSKREIRQALFKNYDGNVIGGILIGIGIALSGAVPGATFLQVGAGVDKSLWVVAGAMLGIFIYGSLERQGWSFTPRHPTSNVGVSGSSTGGSVFKMTAGSAILVAGLLSFALYYLEKWYPWQAEVAPVLSLGKTLKLPAVGEATFNLADPAWSPIESGLIAGLLQIPVFLWSRSALVGKASQYLSTLTFFLYGIDPRANVGENFFNKGRQNVQQYKQSIPNSDFWNVAFVVGILGGAYISNWLAGNPAILSNPVTRPEAFLGGLLLLLGARIASQNTQAHTGRNLTEVSLATMFTVLPLFGSAMVTAHMLW